MLRKGVCVIWTQVEPSGFKCQLNVSPGELVDTQVHACVPEALSDMGVCDKIWSEMAVGGQPRRALRHLGEAGPV
jgi:hypothetical protein